MEIDPNKMFDADELGFPSLDEQVVTPQVEATKVVTPQKEPTPVETQPTPAVETKVEETPVEKTVQVEEKQKSPETTEVKDIKISNPPVQYEGESDIQFNLRTQLYNAGQAKAQATTDEEKSVLTQHMKELRKEMGKNSVTPKPEIETPSETTEDGEEEAARQALKKLGVPDKDEVLNLVKEMIQSQKTEVEHSSAISEFYSKRQDIASDPEKVKMLENVVIQNFNVSPQTSKAQLLVAMDMAANYLFPKQNKSAAVNTAAEKRDLLNISSNTQTVKTVSKEDERTSTSLKEIGMSMKDMGWD